ncbi:SprB repeat-containing protein [Flavobacterium sp.]|uniref:SprB repeat-containing protein n=1 Tax=Flavobacterium sp. TaxID=239 RepID=UPI003D10EE45
MKKKFNLYSKAVCHSDEWLCKFYDLVRKKYLFFLFLILSPFYTSTIWAQISIDGNPSDWPSALNDANNTKKAFRHDPFNSNVDDQWTGGSQDGDASPAANWKWALGNSNDKGDIANAGAVLIGNTLYFFGDRAAQNGDSQIGFWFFLNNVGPNASPTSFNGEHSNGDILIISNFTNGGGNAKPNVYVWSNKTANSPGGLVQIDDNQVNALIKTNTQTYNAPNNVMFNGEQWDFDPKFGDPGTYPPPLFFEGSLDLGSIQGISPCFKKFLLETRNSQSLTASLQDFVAGGFSGVPNSPIVGPNARCGAGSVALSASGCNGTLSWYASSAGGLVLGTGSSFNTPSISQSTTYYVSCTVDGCESERTPVLATIRPLPIVDAVDNKVCVGSSVQLSVSPPGGTWSGNNVSSTGLFDASNLSPGQYNVTYSFSDQNECNNADTAVVTVNALPLIQCPSNESAPVLCGVSQNIAQSQANTDFAAWLNLGPKSSGNLVVTRSYNYSAGATPPNIGDAPLILAFADPTIISTSVTVTWVIKDSVTGCENQCSATWTLRYGCAVSCNSVAVDVKCNGANTGSITVTPTGGILPYNVYLFKLPDLVNPVASSLGINQDGTPVAFSNLYAGDYVAISTDATTNVDTGSACPAKIIEPTALQASDSHADVKCNAGNDGSVTVTFSGGTSPYEVNFNGGGFEAKASPASYSNLTAGTYTWVVKDANGCIIEGSENVGQPTELEASDSHADVKCNAGNDGSVTVTFSGGTSPYEVNFNGGGFEAKASPASYSNLTAGTYTWVVKDANGCIIEGSESVGQPTALQASDSHADVKCNAGNDGSVTVTFSGGTSPYEVNFNGGGFEAKASPASYSNLTAGTYTWVVKDANGCIIEGSENVGQPTELEASDSHADVKCNAGNDGSVTVTFSGGTSPYEVNFNGGGFEAKASPASYSNLTAGTYTWVVKDANGCIIEGSENVGQPTELEASDNHTDVKCNAGNDGSVTVIFSGGTSPYEVNFNGGGFEAKASPASYSNLTAGTYTWVVKDANGCIIEGSEIVGQPTELEASDNHTDVKCNAGNDGSVTVTFSGGTSPYEVNFNGGGFEAKASPASYSNLTAGTYTWVVKDANGCIIEGSENVGQPTELEASDSHADVKCNAGNDGSVTVTFSGGTSPYEVNFNGGGFEAKASPASYSNLTAGTYTWVVKDANGCIIEGSESVGQPTALQASDSHADVKCNAGNDGSVTVTFSGGTSPYEVNFNGGGFEAKASPASYSNLTAGTVHLGSQRC